MFGSRFLGCKPQKGKGSAIAPVAATPPPIHQPDEGGTTEQRTVRSSHEDRSSTSWQWHRRDLGAGLGRVSNPAAAEINVAGGVLGEEVDLVFCDCGFTPDEAVAAVDMLMDVEGSDAIVGAHPSHLRDPITRRIFNKAPYIYTPQYEGVACGPSTVAIGNTDEELLGPALQWFHEVKGRAERYFFVGNDYIWPHMAARVARRLIRRQGSRLVGQAFVPNHSDQQFGILKTIAKSGAQVVIQALVGQCAIDFNRAFATAGLDEKMLPLWPHRR